MKLPIKISRRCHKVSFAFFCLFLTFQFIWQIPAFPFVPVFYIMERLKDQRLCYMNYALEERELVSLENILNRYAVPHLRIGARILIPLKCLLDKDTMQNYTSKAGLKCPDNRFKKDNIYNLWIEIQPDTTLWPDSVESNDSTIGH